MKIHVFTHPHVEIDIHRQRKKFLSKKKKGYEEMYFFIPSPKEESALATSNLHITLDHNSE